jgi:hypothetical protein
VNANILINEVMPHSNNLWGDEWVELYNPTNQSTTLNGLIGDDEANDTLSNLTIPAFGFALIVDTGTELNNATGCKTFSIPAESCVELAAIGNGLNDEGESLFLYDDLHRMLDNYTWIKELPNNISAGRWPDGGSWNETLPTPGNPNQLFIPHPNVKLSVYLKSPAFVGITYTKLFKIEIQHKPNCTLKDNVTVEYNITLMGTVVKEGKFERGIGCSGYAGTGEWLPNQIGEFELCGRILATTVNETNVLDNFACKNISVVENPVMVQKLPTSANFGDFKFISISFNTSYYGHDRVRFLVYGKSKRVIAYLNWTKIKTYAQCQGETAIQLNVTPNRTYHLFIPFFIYPNCDAYYSEGNYTIALRVCKPQWEKYLEHVFTLSIMGRNERLCPTPKTKIVYREVVKTIPTQLYRILLVPSAVRIGEEFNVLVSLENPSNVSKNFSVYSYVYLGRNLVSEGFTGGRWLRTWHANQQRVTVAPKSSITLTLTNRIKEGTEPGTYTLKVRIKGVQDLVRNLTVLPALPPLNVNLSCAISANLVAVKIKNTGRAANFTLAISQAELMFKRVYLEETEAKELKFNLAPRNQFFVSHDGKVLANCTVFKPKVPEKITGRLVQKPHPVLALLWRFLKWLGSLFGFK